MKPKPNSQRLRRAYAKLLCLYPEPFRQRFAKSMEQTFSDILRERSEVKGRLFPLSLWLFAETLLGIFKEHRRSVKMGIKDIVTIAFFPILLLLVPLIGMQFSDEVNWGPGDFIVAGALLLGTSFAIWLTLKKTSNLAYRSAMALAVMGGLLLIWINLAIGLIGHEGNPANLMYLAIFAVGIIGSGMARLKPKGMAGTMITAAVVQVLIAVIVLITSLIRETGEPMLKVLLLNGIFVFLFCLSALLFWNAANSGIRTATSR